MKKYNVALVGATGVVGQETLSILHERNFPIDNLYCIASRNSLGKKVNFGGESIDVDVLESFDFKKCDLVISCAGSNVSSQFVDDVIAMGKTVIDEASIYRLRQDIPLVIPEINKSLIIEKRPKLISSPNCCVVPIALVINNIVELGIETIYVTSLQSVSGAGMKYISELYERSISKLTSHIGSTGNDNHRNESDYEIETNDEFEENHNMLFDREIEFNLIPKIGKFVDNGYTEEELKISNELSKIFQGAFMTYATCVRVPVFIGHSFVLNIDFKADVSLTDLVSRFLVTDGVIFEDEEYVTPSEMVGTNLVNVSRLRKSKSNSISLWLTYDNLRKGAALNMVQIAENIVASGTI